MASQIASEVLKDNAKLRGVHSKESIKKILENEARRQMQMHSANYQGPMIVKHDAADAPNMKKKTMDPSNLPYLHKNPAVWNAWGAHAEKARKRKIPTIWRGKNECVCG